MLEYSTSEAKELLQEKIVTAEKSISQLDADLDYIKEQITTLEVSTYIGSGLVYYLR